MARANLRKSGYVAWTGASLSGKMPLGAFARNGVSFTTPREHAEDDRFRTTICESSMARHGGHRFGIFRCSEMRYIAGSNVAHRPTGESHDADKNCDSEQPHYDSKSSVHFADDLPGVADAGVAP